MKYEIHYRLPGRPSIDRPPDLFRQIPEEGAFSNGQKSSFSREKEQALGSYGDCDGCEEGPADSLSQQPLPLAR